MKPISLLLVLLMMTGCSYLGLGSGKKDIELNKPAELLDFSSELAINKRWSHKVGGGAGKVKAISVPAIDQGIMYAADQGGSVIAVDIDTGARLWKREFKKTQITGSAGAAEGLVLFGTDQGQVVALDQQDGAELWRATVSSEVLSSPVTNGDVVVTLTLDGRVHGLDAEDGSPRWLIDTNLPLLTVRGNAKPLMVEDVVMGNNATTDLVYVGHDNGKLSAYLAEDGVVVWESRVGIPEGRTDLERMVDIDGSPLYLGGTVYAVSFQGGLMAMNPATGRAIWFQEASSHNGAGAWGGTVAITEVDGKVQAFNASEGTQTWETEEYAYRGLNSPGVTSSFVVFADAKGYLHFLSRRNGKTIGRRKVGGAGVRAPTLIHNDLVIVLDNSGSLSAYEVAELDN